MARVLVCWTRPAALRWAEADDWSREEAARLATARGVKRVELTRLGYAKQAHSPPGDWLLELYLEPGVDADMCLSEPICADSIRDMRLLGMRPTVAIADTTTVVGPWR
jgi:hypothetical protein